MKIQTISFFAQIIKHIPRLEFNNIVQKHHGDRFTKKFTAWDQLIAMLWCQFSGAESLREIEIGLQSGVGRLQHINARPMARSTLAYANEKRSYKIFEELYYCLKKQLFDRPLRGIGAAFDKVVLSLDSTTISLCLSQFPWAHYRRAKGGVKVHTLLNNDILLPEFMVMTNAAIHDNKAAKEKVLQRVPPHCILVMDRGYCDFGLFKSLDEKGVVFVTRMKTSLQFKRTGRGVIDKNYGDFNIQFTSATAIKKLGESNKFRAVKWYSKEDERWLVFLTNAGDNITAEQVAKLYKDRWQIELFFKRMKQNLKIVSFVGTTENAVLVQIWTAAISVLLQMYLQNRSSHKWSFSNLVKCIRLNLMTMKDLAEWLDRPDVCSYSSESSASGPPQQALQF